MGCSSSKDAITANPKDENEDWVEATWYDNSGGNTLSGSIIIKGGDVKAASIREGGPTKINDFFIPPKLEPYRPKLVKTTSTEKREILKELDDAEAKP